MEQMEQILIQKLKQGDRRAFEEFYNQTYKNLYSYVLGRIDVVADAQELAHDAYLSFLDSLPLFRGGSSLKTFLYAIVKHEVADYFRKKYAKKAIMTVPYMDHVYTEKLYTSLVLNEQIERIYARLAKDYVVILRLRYEEDMKVEIIANHLRLTLKATESRLWRARKAFQKAYLTIYG